MRVDFQPGKSQNRLRRCDAERILAACAARCTADGYASRVTQAAIAAQDFNLSIARYVDPSALAGSVDIGALRREREALRQAWMGIEQEMAAHLKDLGFE